MLWDTFVNSTLKGRTIAQQVAQYKQEASAKRKAGLHRRCSSFIIYLLVCIFGEALGMEIAFLGD